VDPFIFPPKLKSIDITFPFVIETSEVNGVINAISRLTNLNKMKLASIPLDEFVSFAPLIQLAMLEIFKIVPSPCLFLTHAHANQIRSMHHITQFTQVRGNT
jgi:hypothetical protein